MGVVWYITVMLMLYGASSVTIEPCKEHKSCGDCIQDALICVWCAMENFNGTRCKLSNSTTNNWCEKSVENPENQLNVPKENNLNFNSKSGVVIQIKPQKYNMALRPGLPAEFNFSYKAASDYPVDLYFLMDASTRMSNMKDTIVQQSENIYNTMANLTKNVYLGMGTFIDKNTFPFTRVINSEETYSFKNHLKLSDNVIEFKKAVSNIKFGSNLDDPEGGLDALAQVISCTDQIGWRNESRKIVIFLTRNPFHCVGDGILAGIFQPYDGGCYTVNNTYTKELDMDYPSVGLLNKMASDRQITIIFFVHNDVTHHYSRLSDAISGSKSKSYDDTQIITVLKDIYEEITKTIKLKVNTEFNQRNNFEIKFEPNCYSNATINQACKVKTGEEKHIKATIRLKEYNGVDNTAVNIAIEGMKEKLTLNVTAIKDCKCQAKGVPGSKTCSNAGTLECGICKCDADRYGDKCACIANSKMRNENDNSTCIADEDSNLCSGHGDCICGSCICTKDSPYEGKYCQYNRDNCPRMNNKVCNGHGRCEDEKCICTGGWTGNACECPQWDKPCSKDGKVCNNRGVCKCGQCDCNKTARWDVRENQDSFCNILPCPDCHEPQCNVLSPCAICLHSGEKTCTQCDIFKTSTTPFSISSLNKTWNICPIIRVGVGCYTRFMYKYDDNEYNIELVVMSTEDCVESNYMVGGIFLASLILIGVATIVGWKWLTDARDRREFEKFLKEIKDDVEPCNNPTYRPASTTINNPAFRKPSVTN